MITKKFQKSYFDVLGLCCSSEIPLIEKILKPMVGVREVSVIVASRTVIVVHDNLVISQLQIVNALNQARLEANIRGYGEPNYRNKWPSPYAIACGVFLLLSLLKYVYNPLKWFAIVAVVVGIVPIILKGYAALRNFTLDTNILVLIAVMGSIALRDYWEAASIVFLFTIAQWLESRASYKATAVMSSLMNMVPQKAVLAETGEEVDASEVLINTILAVKPGENIPIDGIVIDGKCEVDEKTLTGESFPVFKKIDSIVWAGTINLNGYISVKTMALAEDCAVAKMAKLVEEAQNNKSKTQRFIDRCAKFYTPAIMAISIGLAAIPAILKVHNLRHWLHLALVVLVSACPCALILSTPVATFCALSKAATSGLLIKGGEYLETLAKIKIMAFDKTGTITRGEFVVTEFQCLVNGVTLDKLLYWVSSIESKSSHPMAAALIDYGRSLSIEPNPEKVEEFENFPGEGILGRIDGKDIYVGNRKIASRAGCETVLPSLGVGGKSIGYIFLEGVSAGIFSLSDTCRTGAKEAINELKSLGIKTSMLTGDNTEAATITQNQLGGALEVIHAELLPQDKAYIIKEFQKQGPTAMVGDGLNDAPALATADIGISMGVSGSALANETCHIILMSNDMTKIPLALKLARKTQMKVVQNVIFSILTKVGILALAFAGYPLVWAAVLADVGTCLVVILNSMLLLKTKEVRAKKSCKSSWKSFFQRSGCNDSHSHGNHSCHSHKHDHSHEHESSSNVHLLNGSEPCHGHSDGCAASIEHSKEAKNGHAKSSKHGHGHSHGHGNHNCHGHKNDHSHEHKPSSDVHVLNVSKMCRDHTNVYPAYVEHSKEAKTGHAKSSKHSQSHGNHDCHSHKHDHSQSSSDVHKHQCSKPCDDHEKSSRPRQTNECCVQKDQVTKVDYNKHNHSTTCDGEHTNFYYTEAKSCETEKCLNLTHKHEHDVEFGESHSDHLPSDVHCHSTHCITKHEDNGRVHDKVVDVCGNNNECENYNAHTECSVHEKGKSCSSNLKKRHIARCCRSLSKECCNRNMGFGENVTGLSEIVVQ